MHLEFNVATKPEFYGTPENPRGKFNPTKLEAYIAEGPAGRVMIDGVEHVKIHTVLTQTIADGTLVEARNLTFPAAQVLPILAGYDHDAMKPVIDQQGLAAVLSAFNLQLG